MRHCSSAQVLARTPGLGAIKHCGYTVTSFAGCSEDRARRVSQARARRIESLRHSESAAKVTAEAEAVAEAAAARIEAAAAAAEEEGKEPEPEPEPVGPCQVSLIIKADVQVRSAEVPHALHSCYASCRCNGKEECAELKLTPAQC